MSSTVLPVVWTIGLVRDPAISYEPAFVGTPELRRPFFVTRFREISDAVNITIVVNVMHKSDFTRGMKVSGFTTDYSAKYENAMALDKQIVEDALKISQEYADLVSLAARQT